MTRDQARAIYNDIHRAFDRLLADYLQHHPGSLPSTIKAEDLMHWSHRQTVDPKLPATQKFDEDLEEGDSCPIIDCTGKMGFRPVDDCSCHLRAPCSAHESNPLVCLECGWQFEEES